MSYRQIDAKGKPIPRDGRSTRKPAEKMINGKPHYHYEIAGAIPQPGGKRIQYRKRFWLSSDIAADAKEREILHKPSAQALTWVEAHRRWADVNRAKFSQGHISNSEITLKQWCASFGAGSTIEETTLAAFTEWVEERARVGKGRGAQIKRGHLLAIARWCRARGLVMAIPFEHAPQPTTSSEKRKAADVDEYREREAILPPHMVHMWRLMAMTGMRISAACGIREDRDITQSDLTVTTKGSKRISYTITPAIAQIIADAKAVKAQGYTRGTGKNKVVKAIETTYLFCNSRGVPWNKSSYNNQLKRRCEKAKLPFISAHQLRHMAGTLMAEKNLSADIIQAGLAHSTRESSEVYIDQTRNMRDQALAAVADSLQIFTPKNADSADPAQPSTDNHDPDSTLITCPHCHRNFSVSKE